ncbi:hypothetical protein C7410_10179 [Paraburkholderia silvatlantica]|uniref:Uncharacterized protein n=1 Tax=Paraburkholderia silvatlantica TaxID=321895 RepID=A0A2V4U227_9BURK|nr:hypothetical protein C7410_10179 [Paraburkholderia silvatlantica]
MLGPATSVTQCTVFAYEFGNRPRTVSVADHRGGRFLRDVALSRAPQRRADCTSRARRERFVTPSF